MNSLGGDTPLEIVGFTEEAKETFARIVKDLPETKRTMRSCPHEGGKAVLVGQSLLPTSCLRGEDTFFFITVCNSIDRQSSPLLVESLLFFHTTLHSLFFFVQFKIYIYFLRVSAR